MFNGNSETGVGATFPDTFQQEFHRKEFYVNIEHH